MVSSLHKVSTHITYCISYFRIVCSSVIGCIPRQVIERALEAYTVMPRVEWVVGWPGQAVLCVSQKYWTAYVHEAIRNGQKVTKYKNYMYMHVHVIACILTHWYCRLWRTTCR